MSLYKASAPQFVKILRQMVVWLDKAEAHATERKYDVDVLMTMRLAPDMYPLVRQFGAAADSAKFGVAHLVGREAPKHPDTETTVAEIRARLASVIEWIGSFTEADFEGAKDRAAAPAFLRGGKVAAGDYLNQMSLPNFYFHVSMAYALLRHSGVPLGKMDFIGDVPLMPQ